MGPPARRHTILTAQTFSPYQSEKYVISANTWKNEGTPPVTGRPADARDRACDADSTTARRSSSAPGTSTATARPRSTRGPRLPPGSEPGQPDRTSRRSAADDRLQRLPGGAAPERERAGDRTVGDQQLGEADLRLRVRPGREHDQQAPTPPNNAVQLYWSRMLLPAGRGAVQPGTEDVQLYEPEGGPQEAWRPTISSVTAQVNVLGVGH